MRIKSFLLLLLLANVVLAPQRVRGAADVVHTTYSVGALGGSYVGDATFVKSSSGNINGFIDLRLVSGTPVVEATDLNIVSPTPFGSLVNCDATFYPSGRAKMLCHS